MLDADGAGGGHAGRRRAVAACDAQIVPDRGHGADDLRIEPAQGDVEPQPALAGRVDPETRPAQIVQRMGLAGGRGTRCQQYGTPWRDTVMDLPRQVIADGAGLDFGNLCGAAGGQPGRGAACEQGGAEQSRQRAQCKGKLRNTAGPGRRARVLAGQAFTYRTGPHEPVLRMRTRFFPACSQISAITRSATRRVPPCVTRVFSALLASPGPAMMTGSVPR